MSSHPHYWQGDWIDDAELAARIARLPSEIDDALEIEFDLETVLTCADQLGRDLVAQGAHHQNLARCLIDAEQLVETDVPKALAEVGEVLLRASLEEKLRRELGSLRPFTPSRATYDEPLFEAWAPVGFLVHVASQNSFSVGAMSVVEGLLSGNVNFLKTGAEESLFAALFLEALCSYDPHRRLQERVIVARLSSKKIELLKRVFSQADAIAAWGGEESIAAIKKLAPPRARLIEWGHRISFIYVSQTRLNDWDLLTAIARECCLFEQLSCSSPQVIYLDTQNWDEVKAFGHRLADELLAVSPRIPAIAPSRTQAAEISVAVRCHQLHSILHDAEVIEAPDASWRLFLDVRPALQGSPLFRSVWIKPLPSSLIKRTLRPMGAYLQTAGLACATNEILDLSQKLLGAGAQRLRRIGEMTGGYAGEPHDGVYSLQRYCRRVSLQLEAGTKTISNFSELQNQTSPFSSRSSLPPVTHKEAFENLPTLRHQEKLFFKSGGSTGEPKLSTYSYGQYHLHTRLGAEGLMAAGLDPENDRTMNLFFGGSLYGGFLSIFSALEVISATQFPMTAVQDFEMVATTIIKNKVNVLMGSPSYLLSLLDREGDRLRAYGKIEKIFYGGEHFSQGQRTFLQSFGTRLIRSAAYGSVDIGPLGYQCSHCEGSEHHLHHGLQYLEILKLHEDIPVKGSEIGRLIFTSKDHSSNKPPRYEIGDVGQWVDTDGTNCACGRAAPRFRLLGRMGDTFRAGSMYLNYQKFMQILSQHAGYEGELQIIIDPGGIRERLTLLLSNQQPLSEERAKELCCANYADLNDAVVVENLLRLECLRVDPASMFRTQASGKLVHVLDRRGHS